MSNDVLLQNQKLQRDAKTIFAAGYRDSSDHGMGIHGPDDKIRYVFRDRLPHQIDLTAHEAGML